MKNLILPLLLISSAPAAFSAEDPCTAYVRLTDAGTTFQERVVHPEGFNSREKGMVQATILVDMNPMHPVTIQQAMDIFTDRAGRGGQGGNITYQTAPGNTENVTYVRVTYYPGDNEYGALFSDHRMASGEHRIDFLGVVNDGDVRCLLYPASR